MNTFLKKFLFLWIIFFTTSLFADSIFLKDISISNSTSVKESDNKKLAFKVTIESSPVYGSITIHYKTINNGSATAGTDYSYTEGDLIFKSDGATTQTIEVPILNDSIHESTEHVTVEITADESFYEIIVNQGKGTIYDDDLAPLKLTSFPNRSITETDTEQTLYIDAYFNQNLPSNTTLAYHTVDNTAHAGNDYIKVTSGTVIAQKGNNHVKLPIKIKGDLFPETTKDFKVIIDSISNGTIEDSQAKVTIYDDDNIKVNVDCDDAEEGNKGQSNNVVCRIYLSKPYPAGNSNLIINYHSQDGSSPSATAGDDYTAINGHVTFSTGDKEKIVNIPTIGDNIPENDENVKLIISGSNFIVNSQSEAEILNDDGNFPIVDFSTADVSIIEGNTSTKTLNFHFTLSDDAVADSYFYYYTKDNTAKSEDDDYVAIPKTKYTIQEGTRDINIPVTIIGDKKIENDEQFYLKFTSSHHIAIHGHTAKGNIINDDGSYPKLKFESTIYDILEGNNSTQPLNFILTLDKPAKAGSSFKYTTQDSTAKVDDNDYVKINSTNYTFKGGETKIKIPVTINGDHKIENNEKFYLRIFHEMNLTIAGPQYATGKIINDDGNFPKIQISSENYSVVEGNNSEKILEIKLTLDTPALNETSIDYYTKDNEATDGDTSTEDRDYIPKIGTLTIPKGKTNASIKISIVGDTFIEDDETFKFYIHTPHNMTMGREHTIITIINDDEPNTDPFICNEHMYLSSSKKRGSSETGKMWMHQIDTTQSPFKFEVLNEKGETSQYNAIGYNTKDNYIYGLYYRNLIKISKTGKIINLGKLDKLPEKFDSYQLFAGAIYDNEHYYVAGMGIKTNTMFIINLITKNVTKKTLSQSINIKDFSLSPDGKLLYGIIDSGQFIKIDTNTGIITKIGEPHGGEFDSTFSDKNGRFFANDSKGSGFYEFNTKTGEKAFLSDSQSASFNDGTNCLDAELIFTDYGDAPISYGKAWHNIANDLYLGNKVDHDISSFDTINADGDDLNGEDDEDGVTLVDGTDINGSYFMPNTTHKIKVTLSKDSYLKIWIDKGIDGDFNDNNDLIYSSNAKLSAGEHIIDFNLPNNLTTNTLTYLRARVSSSSNINPTGYLADGEVEDYAIKFGSKFQPLEGRFNIERTNSGSSPIMTEKRNAWYTQIVGRDFDYSLVFYTKDFSAEQNISNVTVKVDLMDMDKNESIYDYSFHIPKPANNVKKSRITILAKDDLDKLPATRNARFKVTYGVTNKGSLIQQDCLTTPALCTEHRSDFAKDNFAIRPDNFLITINDNLNEIITSQDTSNPNILNQINLAAGYEYNLTAVATEYMSAKPAKGYTQSFIKEYDLNTSGTCASHEPLVHEIKFVDGNHTGSFAHENVGRYIIDLLDNNWTKVDQKGSILGCIENSATKIADDQGKVGCDINLYLNDMEVNFQPDHFAVDLNLENLPASGHDEFIYMMELNASQDNVAIAFDGNITAKSANDVTMTNFTAGCVAKDILFNLNTTTVSLNEEKQKPQTDGQIKTIDGTPVNFSRAIRFNNDEKHVDYNNSIPTISAILPIEANKFLNENNGSVNLNMRFNLNKNIREFINPVTVTFHNIEVNSTDATSHAHEVANFIPTGNTAVNRSKDFYYARVASKFDVYPEINRNINTLQRTPLQVDFFCLTTAADYCKDRHVFIHSDQAATSRDQNGWYYSNQHNGDLDGHVISLTPNPAIIEISANGNDVTGKDTVIKLNNGSNGTVTSNFKNAGETTVTVTSTPVLTTKPAAYIESATDINASEWTGVGKTGHVLEIKPQVNSSKKMSW